MAEIIKHKVESVKKEDTKIKVQSPNIAVEQKRVVSKIEIPSIVCDRCKGKMLLKERTGNEKIYICNKCGAKKSVM